MEISGNIDQLIGIVGKLALMDQTIVYSLDPMDKTKVGHVLLGVPYGSGAIFSWATPKDQPTEAAFKLVFVAAIKVESIAA